MPAPAAPAVDEPRPPWGRLALLTLAVLLLHLLLLVLAPSAIGPQPSPLATKFITRTIVIGPPPVAEVPAQAPSPPAAAPAPRPAPPRAVRPRPAPHPAAPATQPPPPQTLVEAAPDTSSQDLIAQPADAAAEAAQPPASGTSAPANAAASAGSGSGSGSAEPTPGQPASGNIAGAVPLRIPGSVRLRFAATAQQGASPMQGVFGDLVWLQDGQHYDARLALNFLFRTVRSQHSTGAIGPTGIEPARFSDTRRTEVASHFVRDQGVVIFSTNAPSVPLLAGAQDRLSIVMQLGALLAGDPARYPPGMVIAVQTVGPRDAEIWTFNVGEEERLAVPAGEFAARKLTRNPRLPFDDKIELWLAPELGYLPVRIRQTQENGDFADLQLRQMLPLQGGNEAEPNK